MLSCSSSEGASAFDDAGDGSPDCPWSPMAVCHDGLPCVSSSPVAPDSSGHTSWTASWRKALTSSFWTTSPPDSSKNPIPAASDLRVAAVTELDSVRDMCRGCEVIYHQAAARSVSRSVLDPLSTNLINTTGTLNVLLAAREAGVRRVVAASSSSVYGGVSPGSRQSRPDEERPAPRTRSRRSQPSTTCGCSTSSTAWRRSASGISTPTGPVKIQTAPMRR